MTDQTCAICGGKHDNPAKWSDDYEGMPWCILSLRAQVADQAARIAALEADAQTRKDDRK